MMTHKILNRDPKDEILKVGVFRSFFKRVTGDVFAIVRPKTKKPEKNRNISHASGQISFATSRTDRLKTPQKVAFRKGNSLP